MVLHNNGSADAHWVSFELAGTKAIDWRWERASQWSPAA